MKKINEIFLVLLVLFVTISAVSAEGNFTALQKDIDTSSGSTIEINQNYVYDKTTDYELNDGIVINRSDFTINGNGYTIDASNQARIFNIEGNNITISNLNFINGYSQSNGGAIFSNGNLNLINCIFENNTANNGGAVYYNNEINSNIITSTFKGNNATESGGAICLNGSAKNNKFTSEFFNNNAKEAGGGIFFYGIAENNTIESIFRNNKACYGAGIFFWNETNKNMFKSDFINNTAKSCGGAIFFYNKTNYNTFQGNYINNRANGLINKSNGNGGAINFKDTSKNSIFNCDFISNTVRLYGGAVNYRETPYNITFNCNFMGNNAKNGGGLHFFEAFENITFNCNFIDNNATSGGGIDINNEKKSNNSSSNKPISTIGSVANCNFTNNHAEKGGAIHLTANIRVENCNFTNNYAIHGGGVSGENVELKNCIFNANKAEFGASVDVSDNGTIENSEFLNSPDCIYSMISAIGLGNLFVNNCRFLNSTSKYAPAIYTTTKNKVIIKNSFFKDLHASLSSGAIAIKAIKNSIEIENCIFINTSAVNNGGALFVDVDEDIKKFNKEVTVKNTTFENSSADFGGSIVQLGGNLKITDSKFLKNSVICEGGAIYASYTNLELDSTQIISNRLTDEKLFNGGGIYCDKSNVTISNSLFENNEKNAIYSYGCALSVENTTFRENSQAIHGVFTTNKLKDNDYGNDTLFLNDTNYPTTIKEKGMEIELINNTINVTNLPSHYDSRDWGWVSSVKDQGEMGSCWTFGNCGALESTLLKETGIEYDFSENNMQNNMLKYAKYGMKIAEGGMYTQGLEYIISWLGIFPSKYDTYDEIGKISPLITSDENIHIQDAIFVESRKNATDNDALKRAIIECGSVTMNFFDTGINPYYDKQTHAAYQNYTNNPNHSVSVVGWDDNYSASNFIIRPPGDGAFIIKNSYGESYGDNGFVYLSYYDVSILNMTSDNTIREATSVGYILKNRENYTKIYQRDIGGQINKSNNYTTFKVKYKSIENDLISGVGSYFKENEEYNIEIYINDNLKYTQTGNAPFTGYHTVRLTSEVPIKANDNFTVLMKKDYVPIVYNSTQFYESDSVFVEINNEWVDLALKNKSATLKVYTKDLAIFTEDLVKIYKNASKFEANVAVANATVTFEINGRNYTRVSDENGAASIAINLNPGNYTIKTSYNNFTVENTVTVLPTLIAENLVKYYKNDSQFYISLIDGEGNPVAGVNITMNINGVFYNRTTNENGTAKLNINLPPGEYILTAIDPLTGLQMSYNITVLPTLTATDLEMKYKDGSTFNVTVLDGQGNPLANAAVKFNINGVFYTKHTDSKGIAKLNINLMSGKYIITSEYDGLKISNTITIKD